MDHCKIAEFDANGDVIAQNDVVKQELAESRTDVIAPSEIPKPLPIERMADAQQENLGLPERIAMVIVKSPDASANLDEFCKAFSNENVTIESILECLNGCELFSRLTSTDLTGKESFKWKINDSWEFVLTEGCFREKNLPAQLPFAPEILCGMAIQSTFGHMVHLDGIYAFVRNNFDSIHKLEPSCCKAIRQALITSDNFQRLVDLTKSSPQPAKWGFTAGRFFDLKGNSFYQGPLKMDGSPQPSGYTMAPKPLLKIPYDVSIEIANIITNRVDPTEDDIIRAIMDSRSSFCDSYTYWKAEVEHELGLDVHFCKKHECDDALWMIKKCWVFDGSRFFKSDSDQKAPVASSPPKIILKARQNNGYTNLNRSGNNVFDTPFRSGIQLPVRFVNSPSEPSRTESSAALNPDNGAQKILTAVDTLTNITHLQENQPLSNDDRPLKRSSPLRMASDESPIVGQSLGEVASMELGSLVNSSVSFPEDNVVEATIKPIESDESMPVSEEATSDNARAHKNRRGRPKKLSSSQGRPSAVKRPRKRPAAHSPSANITPKRANISLDRRSNNTKQKEICDSTNIRTSARLREKHLKKQIKAQEQTTTEQNLSVLQTNEIQKSLPNESVKDNIAGLEKHDAGINLEENPVVEGVVATLSASSETSDIMLVDQEESAEKLDPPSTDASQAQDAALVSEDAVHNDEEVRSSRTESSVSETLDEPEEESVPTSKEAESLSESSKTVIDDAINESTMGLAIHIKKEPIDDEIICLGSFPIEAKPQTIDDKTVDNQLDEEGQLETAAASPENQIKGEVVEGENREKEKPRRPFESVSKGLDTWYSFARTLTGDKAADEICFKEAADKMRMKDPNHLLFLVIEMTSEASADVPEELLLAAEGIIAFELNKEFEPKMEKVVGGRFKTCNVKVPSTADDSITASIWQRGDRLTIKDRKTEENLFSLIENKFTISKESTQKICHVIDIIHLIFIDK